MEREHGTALLEGQGRRGVVPGVELGPVVGEHADLHGQVPKALVAGHQPGPLERLGLARGEALPQDELLLDDVAAAIVDLQVDDDAGGDRARVRHRCGDRRGHPRVDRVRRSGHRVDREARRRLRNRRHEKQRAAQGEARQADDAGLPSLPRHGGASDRVRIGEREPIRCLARRLP